jgi:hypothetical protein
MALKSRQKNNIEITKRKKKPKCKKIDLFAKKDKMTFGPKHISWE